MSFRAPQANFSKGELGPPLYGRYDVDAWKAAVKTAKNVTILKYGGLEKRQGFRLVSEVIEDGDEDVRLIPFEFSSEQSYALEFGEGYMSPVALGGRLLDEELYISNVSSSTEAQVTAAFHGMMVGDLAFIDGLSGDMGSFLNGRFLRVVSVIDDNNFTIDADTTNLTFEGSSGGITRTAAPDPVNLPTVPEPAPAPTPPSTAPSGGGGGGYGRDTNERLEAF